jgi:hypothetical protein
VEYCERLPVLPASLQLLHIRNQPGCQLLADSCLSQLTGLKQLALQDIGSLDPEVLHSMSQLQHLVIDLPNQNIINKLLPVLAGFTQLRHLYLDYENPEIQWWERVKAEVASEDWEDQWFDMDREAFAALTASTQLTHLAIKGYLYCGAGEYMFPEGRQLPHLVTLCLEYSCDSTDHVFRRSEIDATFLCMVAACPALRSLSLGQNVDGDSVVPGLQGFTRLQELCCRGFSNLHSEVELILAPMTQLTQLTLHCPHDYRDAPHSESLSQGLAQLTQLQKLILSDPIGLTDAGVLQLTALTRLSSLTIQRSSDVTVGRVQVSRCDDEHHDCGPVQVELTSKVRTASILCTQLAAC